MPCQYGVRYRSSYFGARRHIVLAHFCTSAASALGAPTRPAAHVSTASHGVRPLTNPAVHRRSSAWQDSAGEEMIVAAGLGLKLVRISERGIAANERIHLEAVRDVDLSFYVVIFTIEITPGRIFAGSRPAYWFEPQKVNAGDNVVLYTRSGMPSKAPGRMGS